MLSAGAYTKLVEACTKWLPHQDWKKKRGSEDLKLWQRQLYLGNIAFGTNTPNGWEGTDGTEGPGF